MRRDGESRMREERGMTESEKTRGREKGDIEDERETVRRGERSVRRDGETVK